jgi:hypothetical protein
MSSKSKAIADLAKHAEALRKELVAAEQNALFRAAVEAGCLAAFADLEVDDAEKHALVTAVGVLSVGDVVEWETDALVDECAKRIADDGIEARVAAVGEALKQLGHAEAGLLLAALVADASAGVDNIEYGVLEAVAEAAGVPPDKLTAIVHNARGG